MTLNEENIPLSNYSVAASPNNSATVNVTDDDSLPLLRISAPTTPIAESAGSVNFVITSTIDLGSNFQVRYNPSEVGSGDFLNESTTPTNQEAITTQQIDFTGTTNVYTANFVHSDS